MDSFDTAPRITIDSEKDWERIKDELVSTALATAHAKVPPGPEHDALREEVSRRVMAVRLDTLHTDSSI